MVVPHLPEAVMKDVLVSLVIVLFWCFVLAGTAYLVEWRNWSAWWFVPALILVAAVRYDRSEP